VQEFDEDAVARLPDAKAHVWDRRANRALYVDGADLHENDRC